MVCLVCWHDHRVHTHCLGLLLSPQVDAMATPKCCHQACALPPMSAPKSHQQHVATDRIEFDVRTVHGNSPSKGHVQPVVTDDEVLFKEIFSARPEPFTQTPPPSALKRGGRFFRHYRLVSIVDVWVALGDSIHGVCQQPRSSTAPPPPSRTIAP